jgi:hypothetical protein
MTALELIKQGWTQGASARDKDGKEVVSGSPEAVKWSALGAICCSVDARLAKYERAKAKLAAVIGTANIIAWDDAPERTQAEVIAAFEKAGI